MPPNTNLSTTLSAILTIADQDSKQSTLLSSLDIIDTIESFSTYFSNSNIPNNTFNVATSNYVLKECKDIISNHLPEISHPFSAPKLLFTRIITPMVENNFTVDMINEVVNESLELSLTLNESYATIIRKDRL